MTGSRRGPGSRRRHGAEVRRSTDDIKEQLKASLQRCNRKEFSLVGILQSCIQLTNILQSL